MCLTWIKLGNVSSFILTRALASTRFNGSCQPKKKWRKKNAGVFYLHEDSIQNTLLTSTNTKSETGTCLLILWLNMRFRIKSTTEDHRWKEKSKHFHSIYDVVQRKRIFSPTLPNRVLAHFYIRVSMGRDVSIDLLKWCKDVFHLVYSTRLSFVMSLYLHTAFLSFSSFSSFVFISYCQIRTNVSKRQWMRIDIT